MSKKFLHVKSGVVKAVTLEGEVSPSYGEIVEVPLDAEFGVGDAYPAEQAAEAPKAKASAKGKTSAPVNPGADATA